MKYIFTLLVFTLLSISLVARHRIKVLFIGNSFTYVNDLPHTVAQIASGLGDTVIYDSNTPGGYTFQAHTTNATTLAKIAQGGWDYVVLQAQSEEPSFPPSQVQTATYPYAHILDSLVHAADSCTETVFYLTWGHQNGDPPNCAGYPQICTYSGMQDRLTQSYLEMGQLNHATVSPAGEAWRKMISEHHAFDLYNSDSIHPSIYGTYLTASVFYEILFRKSVLNDTFVTSGIADSNALQLRQAAHTTVSDSLSKWLSNGHIPVASFTNTVTGTQAVFNSTSLNGEVFSWSYGDGASGSGTTVSHSYAASGAYPVTLTVYDHCKTSSSTVSVTILVSGINAQVRQDDVRIYPNPASTALYIDLGDTDIKGVVFILRNELGETVRQVTPSSPLTALPVTDLPTGVYTLSISDSAYQIVIRR